MILLTDVEKSDTYILSFITDLIDDQIWLDLGNPIGNVLY